MKLANVNHGQSRGLVAMVTLNASSQMLAGLFPASELIVILDMETNDLRSVSLRARLHIHQHAYALIWDIIHNKATGVISQT